MRSVKWEGHKALWLCIPQIVIHLRGYLRDLKDDEELFLSKSQADELAAGDLLRCFFTYMDKNGGEIGVAKCRELCAWRSARVLAVAIRAVLELAVQPLIPPELAFRLMQRHRSFTSAANRNQRADLILITLEELATWRFEILGSLCAIIKDCKPDKGALARELGPAWLLASPDVSLTPMSQIKSGKAAGDVKLQALRLEEARTKDEMVASNIMRALIEECDAIFGVKRELGLLSLPSSTAAAAAGGGEDEITSANRKSAPTTTTTAMSASSSSPPAPLPVSVATPGSARTTTSPDNTPARPSHPPPAKKSSPPSSTTPPLSSCKVAGRRLLLVAKGWRASRGVRRRRPSRVARKA